ncbi:response regulator [Yoonia litorea]|uniref:Two component transcriptional regulator, LuxR family n=1 Tax=Yoonia litorea TaxID=1123755 RepID=A0A1I6M6Y2_9RHOB|nr:response regulator transcription factor [Yoonia litorea]SFS11421.1 two component transcriptional regulator, LuxR family [Yoonia litorea]
MHILLADDHDLVRDTLAMFISAEDGSEVTAVSSVNEAIDALANINNCDLVLLDYNMPGTDGLAGLNAVLEASGDVPVALLSGDATPAIVDQAIASGAAGFVPKTLGAKSMMTAIKFMVAGEIYVPFDYTQQAATPAIEGLTARETQVLKGLSKGQSNKEIARDLDLQEVTIKLHVKTLSRKLGAKNRTHAAMIARDRNLL